MNSARSSLSKGGRSEQRDGGKSARPDVAWFKPRHTGSAPIKSMDGPGSTPSPSPLSPPRPLAPCGEEASKDVFAIRGLPIDFVPFMQRLGATRPAAIRVTPFGDCLLPAFGGKRGKESAAEERFGEETARRKGTRMKADSALDRLRRCSDRLGERRDGEGGKERISRARRAAVRNSLSLSLSALLRRRSVLSETEISRCVDASRSVDSRQPVVSHENRSTGADRSYERDDPLLSSGEDRLSSAAD